jgi:hypothetical protein
MVVQQGLQLLGLELADLIEDSSDELNNDSAYESDPRRQLLHLKGCLQLVQ